MNPIWNKFKKRKDTMLSWFVKNIKKNWFVNAGCNGTDGAMGTPGYPGIPGKTL